MDAYSDIMDVQIVSDDEVETLPLCKEVAWDFIEDKAIVDKSGNFKMVEGKDAVKVWCYHAIKTNRFEHDIYSWDYGTELVELVGQKYSKGLTESEAYRYIKEALLINPYILDVKDGGSSFYGDTLDIHILINTIYGEVELNV